MVRRHLTFPLALAATLGCGSAPNPSDNGAADAGGPSIDATGPGDGLTGPSDAQTLDGPAPPQGGSSMADARLDAPEDGATGLAADAGSWSCDAYGTDLCFCRSGSEGGSAAGCGGSWSCCFLASSSTHYSCECTSDDPTTCASTVAMIPNGVLVATCPPP